MSTVLWIAIGVVVIAICCSGKKSTSTNNSGSQKKVLRIDHPHYYDVDEYECSICGARFRKQSMVCPHCGTRFTETKEDDTEFEEEMMEEEDWDEEEGL